ncbi:TetR/AcrR family transcriptional regulator [Longispora albida]|uniref:TetR/AcrR family transcriptional regulator n=1 Tax=Longispora albida TaxID=203523 RepID=UPI00037CFA17|nr:TetR/AcrR family transcriptional regulator [Longispora albida]
MSQPLADAVLGLLGSVGYERMTMDAIAAQARMSKATIYRRWPGKAELVIDTLRQWTVRDNSPTADTGSLRGDLLEMLAVMAEACKADGRIMQALSFAMQSNPELARRVRELVFPIGERHAEIILRRSAQRGELVMPPPASLFHDLAPALLLSRFLGLGEPLDREYLAKVADEVLLPVLQPYVRHVLSEGDNPQ